MGGTNIALPLVLQGLLQAVGHRSEAVSSSRWRAELEVSPAGHLPGRGLTGLLWCRMEMIKELTTHRPCTNNYNLLLIMPLFCARHSGRPFYTLRPYPLLGLGYDLWD